MNVKKLKTFENVKTQNLADCWYALWTTMTLLVDACGNTTGVILLRLSEASETMGPTWTPEVLAYILLPNGLIFLWIKVY